MAKLILRLNGKILHTADLESGKEYFAGRATDCEFVLDDYRGISRQHLKIFDSNGIWYCESLSKFLHPKHGEENFESLEMNANLFFSLPPYDFEFISELQQESSADQAAAGDEHMNVEGINNAMVPVESPHQGGGFNAEMDFDDENPEEDGLSDATAVGAIQLSSILRINYPSSSDNETLKLEGQVWTAGRESDCEIQLHNVKVSRKHFELNKNQDGYFVTDLGSSNGTYLNGTQLPPHEPTKVLSGDHLKVLDIDIYFEIKATNLPAVTTPPLALGNLPQMWGNPNPMMIPGPFEYEPTQIGAIPPPAGLEETKKKFDWKKNKVRVALVALVPVLLYGLFSEPDKKSPTEENKTAEGGQNLNFENLPQEQKVAIKDSLGLARNLYVQGKYSLCLAELAKLHETIPFYDNSKELESFCIQGHELTQRKLDNDRKERERAMVEQKIADTTAICEEKFNAQGTVDEVRRCLSQAIELNPEHPKVVELIQRAEDREREKQLLAQRRQEAEQGRQRILGIYNEAVRLKNRGDLLKARDVYQRFVNQADSSMGTQRENARREIASISKGHSEKINFLLDKCRVLGESQKYKEGYESCSEVLKADKTVKEAIELREKYANGLRRQMKVFYEDAKLEESLGNLEAAKEKWKRIRAEDLENGDFYKRATIKLKQYGAI